MKHQVHTAACSCGALRFSERNMSFAFQRDEQGPANCETGRSATGDRQC